MIHLDPDHNVAFIRGICKRGALDKAIRKAARENGSKPDEWLIVALPPDEGIHGIHTSMPFSPPDDRDVIGFRRGV